jgi:hypothetical protein
MAQNTTKPVLGKYMLGSPTFRLKSEADVSAGKIFCAELKNRKRVLVSALHLLGPAGGALKQFTAADCAEQIRGVTITSGSSTASIGSGGKQLLTTGNTSAVDSMDLRGDLVAFALGAKCQLTPIKLRGDLPDLNSQAFIISYLEDGRQALFEGTIVESTSKFIAVKLKKTTQIKSASGSPVVDSAGSLVGMIYGTNDRTTYYLNPGASIYLRLNTELKDVP